MYSVILWPLFCFKGISIKIRHFCSCCSGLKRGAVGLSCLQGHRCVLEIATTMELSQTIKLSVSLYLGVSLIYGMHLFSGKYIKVSIAFAINIDTPVCDEAIAHAEGIILVSMSWAVWFACVGIKLYKRHLCQKDGQHLRRLLKIKDYVSCESDYHVSSHLWHIQPTIFPLHIHLGYIVRPYDYLRQSTFVHIKYMYVVLYNGAVINFIILWTQDIEYKILNKAA